MPDIYFTKLLFIKALLLSMLLLPLQVVGQELTGAWTGTVNEGSLTVTNLPPNGKVVQLTSAITVSAGAAFKVVTSTGEAAPLQSTLAGDFSIVVTAPGVEAKTYTLTPDGPPLTEETVTDVTLSATALTDRLLTIGGNSVYHLSDAVNPLKGSFLNLVSDGVWLYFDNIKPSVFGKRYLQHIAVNGEAPQADVNIRLVQYGQGCVVISQSATYEPLQVFTAEHLAGTARTLGQYTYYRSAELGVFNDAVASFTLKKGYMATFAENDLGTGQSKVYIAQHEDLTVTALPAALKNKVSFIRVFPWRWVAKKGWTNGNAAADTLQCHWNYNWNNNQVSTLDVEYVPIRQTQWWPSYSVTNERKKSTHLLGFNEPDRPDQANMTVKAAIAEWPNLLQSGLRLGSPAVSDGGLNWLFSFMEKADSAGYRVDFVAVHFYRGGQTAQQYYSFLKNIHDRTGRPIWITEWNNGANWTCCTPTYESQATAMTQFLHMLDTTSFVERYALYEWVGATRQMFQGMNPIVLNPAGIIYRDKKSPMAYREDQQYDPYFQENSAPFTPGTLSVLRFGSPTVAQAGANRMFVDEYSGTGAWVQTISLPVVKRGRNFPIVSSATPKTNSDGLLAQSGDGNYISLLGYNTHVGSGSTNSAAATTTPRNVAILGADGRVNTASSFNDVVTSHVVRGALVHNNGIYMAGGSANGIRYAPLGSAATSVPIFTTPGGTRKVITAGGDIYFTSYTAGMGRVYKLAGAPTSALAPTPLPGIPAASASSVATGLALFDVKPAVEGYDLLYYADETPSPALQKYIFEDGTWKFRGTYAITGLTDNVVRDITGELVNGIPTLYGVSFTSIVKLEDHATYTGNVSITATTLVNNPGTVISAFRGIAFSPGNVPITALPQLLWPADAIITCSEATDPSHTGIAIPRDSTDRYTIGYADTSTKGSGEYDSSYYNYTITRMWTATDTAGNQSHHVQTITVRDTIPPVIAVQPLTITLDLAGNATIMADSLDAGTADQCGPIILSIDQNSFTAAGIYTIVFTAADPSDNTSVATVTVEVKKRDQVIVFEPLVEMKTGDWPFSPARASSGLAVTYASANASVAAVAGDTIHITGTGTTTITAYQPGNNIFNEAVAVAQTLSVVELAHAPYNNNAVVITRAGAVLEAEDYDGGGQGNAYWDLTNVNFGWKYRKYEGVDLVSCAGGGYNIDWITFNEWQKYTFRVLDEGYYDVYVNVASAHRFGRIKLDVEGNASVEVDVPRTGSKQRWQNVFAGTVYLGRNLRVMKATMKFIDFGVDKYTLSYRGDTGAGDVAARMANNSNDGVVMPLEANAAFAFYPNPVSDVLTVVQRDDSPAQLQLLGVNGRVLMQITLTTGERLISLAHLPSGVYVLQWQRGTEVVREKIVKL